MLQCQFTNALSSSGLARFLFFAGVAVISTCSYLYIRFQPLHVFLINFMNSLITDHVICIARNMLNNLFLSSN
jgi:hypothetical protein